MKFSLRTHTYQLHVHYHLYLSLSLYRYLFTCAANIQPSHVHLIGEIKTTKLSSVNVRCAQNSTCSNVAVSSTYGSEMKMCCLFDQIQTLSLWQHLVWWQSIKLENECFCSSFETHNKNRLMICIDNDRGEKSISNNSNAKSSIITYINQ